MDAIDRKILTMLSYNANVTATEIGAKVNLSVPAVNKRIQKLENDKIIKSYTVITDAKKVDKPVLAFVLVVLQYGDGVETLLNYVNSDPDILECNAITGEYDYIMKICATDVETLEEKLLNLKRQKAVIKSHTMLSLMEHKLHPTVLP